MASSGLALAGGPPHAACRVLRGHGIRQRPVLVGLCSQCRSSPGDAALPTYAFSTAPPHRHSTPQPSTGGRPPCSCSARGPASTATRDLMGHLPWSARIRPSTSTGAESLREGLPGISSRCAGRGPSPLRGGSHRVTTTTDDGVRVYVNDRLVINSGARKWHAIRNRAP